MDDRISTLHRILLWLAGLTGLVFGLAYYLAPRGATTALGIFAPDLMAICTIGAFLLGGAVGAGFALRSGRWSETRIVTYYLMSWNILIFAGLLQGMLLDGESLMLLPEAMLTAVIGLGLAFVVWERRVKPGSRLASNP
jgi:hypothetical protein